jgi:hypothetical protein
MPAGSRPDETEALPARCGPHRGHIPSERQGQHRILAVEDAAAHRPTPDRCAGRLEALTLSRTEEARGSNPLTSTPTTALVTGLAGRFRRAGAVPGSPTGQQTGSNREQTANRHPIAAKRRSEAKTYLTFRLRGGCSASEQTAPDGSSLACSG